jgi:membrane associated rhomboid family serine protease
MVPAPVGHRCPECARGTRQRVVRPGQRIGAGRSRLSLTNVLLVSLVGIFLVEAVVAGGGSLMNGPGYFSLLKLGASVGVGQMANGQIVGIAVGETWRLFTAMFLHIGIFHILMNGYALYLFGNVVEAEQGKTRFVTAYLVTGLAASAASYAFGNPLVPSAGASGAIFGLFGVFLGQAVRRRDLAFYAARVRSGLTLIALNAIIGFSLQGIDWRAHAGGLLAGLVLGFMGEGVGSARTRRAAFVGAAVAIAAITVALTVWRTNDLAPLVSSVT